MLGARVQFSRLLKKRDAWLGCYGSLGDPASLIMRHRTHVAALSRRLRQQRAHADQIKHRGREDEGPVASRVSAVPQLAQQTDGLHPAEALLDQIPLLLTDRVARMAGGAGIDRTAATRRLGILGDMRCNTHLAEQSDE